MKSQHGVIRRNISFKKIGIVTAGLIGLSIAHASIAETSESDEPIKIGMSTALTGPAKDLGLNMKAGVEAAIAEINRDGGVQGRLIELVAIDDGYEPSQAVPNMYQLIQEENVLAVVGNVGTPTAVAAVPIANEFKTPFYGAFTGAGVLRKTPPDRYVVNYRSSYGQETAAMIDALIEQAGIKPEEIAFFTQRDAYGDAGFEGGMNALRAHGLSDESVIAHGRYARNTIVVENALADILQAPTNCKAVIMVGAYAPCAEFITLATEVGLDALFLNVSFVGAVPLADALDKVNARVIVTQVVPPPMSEIGVVAQYRAAIHAIDEEASPSHGSLEGYLAMLVFHKALESIEGEITREKLVDALELLGEFELDNGLPISLSTTDHQASDQVWATRIQNGRVIPMEWDQLLNWDAITLERTDDE